MAKEMAMQQHNTQNSGKIMDQIAAAKQSGISRSSKLDSSRRITCNSRSWREGCGFRTTAAQKKIELINETQKASAIKPNVGQSLNEGVLRDLIPGNTSKASVDA
jgi:hypothetical protein